MADEVLTETRGRVQVITLNRPDVMNAVNEDLAKALAAAMDEMDANPAISVGVLTGSGRGFCAGMDLKAFAKGSFPTVEGRGFGGITQQPPKKPVIAAVEGFALAGGLELALTCDLIVASEGAKLGIPEVSVGLFAGAGGLLRLPRLLPYGVAMRMALTAEPILAEQALEFGMVTEVTPEGEALAKAVELAEQIAQNAPLALMSTKALVREMQGRTEEEFWAYQSEHHFTQIFSSADALEGANAFADKRAPEWKGE